MAINSVLTALTQFDLAAKDFVIVGSAALYLHGGIRFPDDLDIVVSDAIWSSLAEQHGNIIRSRTIPFGRQHIKLEMPVMGSPPVMLDFYKDPKDIGLDEYLAAPFNHTVNKNGLNFATLGQTKAIKALKKRPKDLKDLRAFTF